METAFIIEWKVPAKKTITIPINPVYADKYNYSVNWGDGHTTTETKSATHTYKKAGTHTIKITGISLLYTFLFLESHIKSKR